MSYAADLSSYNAPADQINWQEYIAWSKQGDGVSRLIIRACEGTSFQDKNWTGYIGAALGNGIDRVYHYQYNHPELNSPQAEAQYLLDITRTYLRPQDNLMMDMEQTAPQADCTWLVDWLSYIEGATDKIAVFYSYLYYIQSRLSGCNALAMYPLGLAAYNSLQPAVPAPWSKMLWWQYSSSVAVPGIPGLVDANKFMEDEHMSFPGPFTEVTAGQQGVSCTLNQVAATFAASAQDIKNIPGNGHLANYDPTGPYLCGPGSYGVSFLVPGYTQQATTITGKPALVVAADSIICKCS